ncbi:hypothetical protein ACOZ38_09585 [Sphaerisporangium viridialbum]|uniref:hypothetical protein n=1 Tax=Sphaerisporangium viridialbum TaxID=46189 RepID=UPI003C770B0D
MRRRSVAIAVPRAVPVLVLAALALLLAAVAAYGLRGALPAGVHDRSPDITAADGPFLVKVLPSTAHRIASPQIGWADAPPPAAFTPEVAALGLAAGDRGTRVPVPATHRPSRPRAPPAEGP